MRNPELSTSANSSARQLSTAFGLIYIVSLFIAFRGTINSMVEIWARSDTFAHGFLILPISLWLIWRRRFDLATVAIQPAFKALIAVIASGMLWLLAKLANVAVIEQLSFIGLLISGIWCIWGSALTRRITFPLGFLFFSVPIGEGLIPPMMEFTAGFVVAMLELSGIPVYREGLFIYIPSGTWSVVEACSGVRYLIASVTLGFLFSYLTYTSYLKRSLFVLFSIVIPILANGLRAYIIVIIGHLSDMRLATGVDHFIYGWFFFGLVMFILFMVGSVWRDSVDDPRSRLPASGPDNGVRAMAEDREKSIVSLKIPAAGLLAILVVVALPLLSHAIATRPVSIPETEFFIPADPLAPEVEKTEWRWKPDGWNSNKQFDATYRHDGKQFAVHLRQYLIQDQDAELINSQNTLVPPKGGEWRIIDRRQNEAEIGGKNIPVEQFVLVGAGQQLLVWSTYRIGGFYTINPYVAKAMEAYLKVTFARFGSTRFVFVTETDSPDVRNQGLELEEFATIILPHVEDSLDRMAEKAYELPR